MGVANQGYASFFLTFTYTIKKWTFAIKSFWKVFKSSSFVRHIVKYVFKYRCLEITLTVNVFV